ncbi:MAG: response regulator [Chitinispirillales bacterium]|jgi:PAS domain S-box-containing protein|nr:response regulator [Chitinispirillales bacterium]
MSMLRLKTFLGAVKRFVTSIQVLLVFMAFAIMVGSSYFFVAGFEKMHLENNAENRIHHILVQLEAEKREIEVLLGSIMQTARSMVLVGFPPERIQRYFDMVTDSLLRSDVEGYHGLYLSLDDNWFAKVGGRIHVVNPNELHRLPWYSDAIEANGEIALTDPHINRLDGGLGVNVVTFSCVFFDYDDMLMGTIAIDMKFERFTRHLRPQVMHDQTTRGSYAVIHNRDAIIIAHPNRGMIGKQMGQLPSGEPSDYMLELMESGKISAMEITNYAGARVIAFFRTMNNGWAIGLFMPKEMYYRNTRTMAIFLSILGAIMAAILSFTLVRIARQKEKADELKQEALEKASEAEKRAMVMLDSAPLGVTMWDKDLNLVDFNYEAARVVGIYEKQEYRERFHETAPEFQPDGRKTIEKMAEIINDTLRKGYRHTEWYHNTVTGESIPFEATAIRMQYRDEPVVVVYCRDLREFKEMIKSMNRAEMAEKSSRTKSKFLASMSHEIRTPMNVILGTTEIQLQDETMPPHQREALMQIYNSSDLLLGIINDILDLSKIEADKMDIAPIKYELASLISDCANVNIMRSSKPTEFELNVDENAPASLYGDELRIKQILNNILSNAFKFTDEGTVELAVAVEKNEEADDDNITLCLIVSDSGHGMTRDQVKKLFTEYARFNIESGRAVQGTGLGMSITHRLVTMMGGSINIESEIDKGTTVTIRLPQKRMCDQIIGKELADNLRKFRIGSTSRLKRMQFHRDYMPYGRVLIVDDVESNIYVTKGLLAPYGLTMDMASSGFEALDKIKAGEIYDVVFMDHMMPKMDGLETTRRMRGLKYDQPIVALTANAVVGQADMFIQNGFDDFISKPIDTRQLNAVLNKLIRDKQPPEVLEKAQKEKDDAHKKMTAATAAQNTAVSPELLAVFAQDSNKALPVIETAAENIQNISSEELQLLTTTIHGMKSALANIGEARLSQMAHVLERAGKTNNKDTIAAQINNFLKALRGITAKAEVESKTRETAETDEDPKYLREQLLIIAEACKNYSVGVASDALESLNRMAWTETTEQVLETISTHILQSNFEEAAETAEQYAADYSSFTLK